MQAAMKTAKAHLKAGRHGDALEALSRLLSQDPNDVDAWIASGAAMIALGQAQDAEQALQVARQLAPTCSL